MRLISKWLIAWAWGGAAASLAAEPSVEHIVIVADSRQLSGWQAWLTNLYNESHLYFALATIITIPALGLVIGKLMDVLLGALGIDLRTRKLTEH